ncbi:MAG: hypothetical protein N2517_05520 [Ignavibacteria bacterium]|nr:hypothetical protein [Ignavibacteria bacterium]
MLQSLNNWIKSNLKLFLDIILLFIGLVSGITFIFIIGFSLKPVEMIFLRTIVEILVYAFVVEEVIRLFTLKNLISHFKERLLELTLAIILLIEIIFKQAIATATKSFLPFLEIEEIALGYLILSQGIIFFSLIIKIIRHSDAILRLRFPPGLLITMSFALFIILGTFFLMLPKASSTGHSIAFVDALFTSTSAVCVTGLIVLDTAKDFSLLGQLIILCLVQLGGLGIMTLTTFLFLFVGGGLSIRMRILMKEFLSPDTLSMVSSLLKKVVLYTFFIELLGAICLYFSQVGFLKFDANALYVAIFHSISAFCNAGFSLFSDSLLNANLSGNYFFKTVVAILIILGGLGFITLYETSKIKVFRVKRRNLGNKLSITTKIVLISTFTLIIFGILAIFLGEIGGKTLGESLGISLFNAFFQSVTSRTAGFNTVPIESLSVFSALVIILLMWIGASPGGTGGGVKTTTVAVAFLYVINYIRGKERLELFNRRIDEDIIKRAFIIIFLSGLLIFVATSILIVIEPNKNPINLLFEVVSAFGTVGLTRNTTFFLSDTAKVLLVVVMFIGRVGIITFLSSFIKPVRELHYSLPKAVVNVG